MPWHKEDAPRWPRLLDGQKLALGKGHRKGLQDSSCPNDIWQYKAFLLD
jgi:hypothetical protein